MKLVFPGSYPQKKLICFFELKAQVLILTTVDKPVDKCVGEKQQNVRKGAIYLEQGMGSQKGENGAMGVLARFRGMGIYTESLRDC